MESPGEIAVYADGPTECVYWLVEDARVVRSSLVEGTFAGVGEEPAFGDGIANDLAAHVKRIEAALHRAGGRADLAQKAEKEAWFYDVCADNAEAACLPGGHRELGGVKPPIDPDRVVRMTIAPGANPMPVLLAG